MDNQPQDGANERPEENQEEDAREEGEEVLRLGRDPRPKGDPAFEPMDLGELPSEVSDMLKAAIEARAAFEQHDARLRDLRTATELIHNAPLPVDPSELPSQAQDVLREAHEARSVFDQNASLLHELRQATELAHSAPLSSDPWEAERERRMRREARDDRQLEVLEHTADKMGRLAEGQEKTAQGIGRLADSHKTSAKRQVGILIFAGLAALAGITSAFIMILRS